MFSVVTWLWGHYYHPLQVYKLHKACKIHLPKHKFFVVTESQQNFESGINVVRLPVSERARCYRRMILLSEKMRSIFGDRIMQIDLDCIFFKDFDPGDNPLTIYKCPSKGIHKIAYGPGMMVFDTGVLDPIYQAYLEDPEGEKRRATEAGWQGSDQAIISRHIHPHESVWTSEDGVFSYRDEVLPSNEKPKGMKVLHFYGPYNPLTSTVPWIRKAYRC